MSLNEVSSLAGADQCLITGVIHMAAFTRLVVSYAKLPNINLYDEDTKPNSECRMPRVANHS